MDFNQEEICVKYNAEFTLIDANLKVGVSKGALARELPINGLRHAIEGDTSGWYIWSGEEPSDDPEFFLPVHIFHLQGILPDVIKYLGLPPGWRFLIAPPDYEDVWQDTSLLNDY